MNKIIAFTDGSALTYKKNKLRLGGIGVYMKDGVKEYFLSKGYKNTTISRMEMTALLYTIRKIPKSLKCSLVVYSDSQFIVNSFNKGWLDRWKQERFIGRINSDIWKKIIFELEERDLMKFKIIHIRGHQENLLDEIVAGNNIADMLASYKNFNKFEDDLVK